MGPVKGPACPMYIIFLPSESNSELSEPHDIKKNELTTKRKNNRLLPTFCFHCFTLPKYTLLTLEHLHQKLNEEA